MAWRTRADTRELDRASECACSTFVSGDRASAPQQGVKQLVAPDIHLPCLLVEHVNCTERAPQQPDGFCGVRRQAHKAFYLLPAVAIMLLLLNMYLCRLKLSENVDEGDRIRRLASREHGKEGEREAGSRAPDLCRLLEKTVSSHEKEGGTQAPSPPRPAALSEAVAEKEDEELRKRKRKTKWLEEGALGAAGQTKRAKSQPPSSLTGSSAEKEEDLFGLLEETVTAAIDTVGSEVEDWGAEFSEDLLCGPLPEMSPQTPPDNDGPDEGPASEEQNLGLSFQSAEQLQGDRETAAGSLFSGDQWYAAQKPFILAQARLDKHSPKERQDRLDEILPDNDWPDEGPVSEEQNLELLLQSAEQHQGNHETAAGPLFSYDQPYAAQEPSTLAQTLLEQDSPKEQQDQLDEALSFQAIASTSRTSELERSPAPARLTPSMQLSNHPFYRLPRGAAAARLLTFDGIAPLRIAGRIKRLRTVFFSVRTLFLKEELNEAEVATLMSLAESLLRFAAEWNPSQLEGLPPFRVMEPAARRFLVVDALWNICSVVGPKMNQAQWWDRLMTHTTIPESVVSYPLLSSHVDWRPFLAFVRNAVEDFRHWRRPSAEVVVALKRKIFCDPRFHPRFRDPLWGPWRFDDEDYWRATGEC